VGVDVAGSIEIIIRVGEGHSGFHRGPRRSRLGGDAWLQGMRKRGAERCSV